MKRLPAALLIATLAASVGARADPTLTAKEAATIARTAKANLRKQLKDPASAQFANLFISARDAEAEGKTITLYVLCGEVNAKNSYGGYTGFQRFTASSAVAGGFIDDDSAESARYAFEEVIWKKNCDRKIRDVH